MRRVVANTPLGDRRTERFFEQYGVGDDLEPIRQPSLWSAVKTSGRQAALVFVGQIGAISTAKAIDLPEQTQRFAGEVQRHRLAVLLVLQSGVELPPGEHSVIGDVDLLDFL